MKADILIKNGTVIDPSRGLQKIQNVAVKKEKIIDSDALLDSEAEVVIDASDCIVSPGLIDHHLHMFHGATDAGVPADVSLLPSGVTTGADAGSAGVATFESFRKTVIQNSLVRIKSYINVSPTGMVTRKYPENIEPNFYDVDRLHAIFEQYGSIAVGLKVRVSKNLLQNFSSDPLKETIRLAESFGCRVVVHVTDPFLESEDLAQTLRPGDVFCHCFHGMGNTILDEAGKIKPGISRAAKNGVIFDACNGRFNYSVHVGSRAIEQGFFPTVISTDLNTMVLYKHPAFSLPFVMSKYLALGMPLMDVFRACTETPARLLGLPNTIGSLTPGSIADIAVFKLRKYSTRFYDHENNSHEGNEVLHPQLTIKNGVILYRDIMFSQELNR